MTAKGVAQISLSVTVIVIVSVTVTVRLAMVILGFVGFCLVILGFIWVIFLNNAKLSTVLSTFYKHFINKNF